MGPGGGASIYIYIYIIYTNIKHRSIMIYIYVFLFTSIDPENIGTKEGIVVLIPDFRSLIRVGSVDRVRPPFCSPLFL